MNAIARPLPVVNGRALPPRLLERLWDGETDTPSPRDGRSEKPTIDALRPRFTTRFDDADRRFEPMSAFLDAADQLYGRISAALAATGLSYAEYQILANLHSAEGSVDVAALALVTAFSGSDVSCLLGRLARAGLVLQSAGADEERVAITQAGSAAAADSAAALDRVASRFVASLSGAESASLEALVERVLP